jgi:hypothetical protein
VVTAALKLTALSGGASAARAVEAAPSDANARVIAAASVNWLFRFFMAIPYSIERMWRLRFRILLRTWLVLLACSAFMLFYLLAECMPASKFPCVACFSGLTTQYRS